MRRGLPERLEHDVHPLLRRQPPDVDEGEAASHAERARASPGCGARVERRRVHSAPPDLDVVHAERGDLRLATADGVYTRRLRRWNRREIAGDGPAAASGMP